MTDASFLDRIQAQLTTWTLVGPFPELPEERRWAPLPLDAALAPPPAGIAADGVTLPPHVVSAPNGALDLRALFSPQSGTLPQAFAVIALDAAEEGVLELAFDADWWTVWWLDGREVAATRQGNGGSIGSLANHIELPLAPGHHTLTVRVVSGSGGWMLHVKALAWYGSGEPVAGARYRLHPQKVLAPYDMVWRYPNLPGDWMTGAPIGNGDFGATIHGGPDGLTFTLGKTDVWQRYPHERDTYMTSFAEFRRIVHERDEDAYRRLSVESLQRHPGKDPHLTTCGALRLRLHAGQNPSDLTARVSLADGIYRLTYNTAAVTACVSHAYDVLALELDRGLPSTTQPCSSGFFPFAILDWEFGRPPPDPDHPNPPPRLERRGDDFLFEQELGQGDRYVVGIRCPDFAGIEQTSLPDRLCVRHRAPSSRTVRLLLTVATARDAADPRRLCVERLDRAARAGTATILAEQQAHWARYWERGLALIGDPEVNRMYYRSLYLCGAMLSPGRQSPGLQGVWCGELSPPWNGDYHADVNIQSVYWGLFANDRTELLEPFVRLYTGFAAHAREVARDVFGMRGANVAFAVTIDGHEYTRGAYWGNAFDPACAGWIAQLFWHYYDYTRDRQWLAKTGYPFLRDVARFLADYLQRDEATGAYYVEPSVHFETPRLAGFGRNAHYALTWFRVGLGQAIRAAEVLACDADERAAWQERLDHLADLPIESGYFKILENKPIDPENLGRGWLRWLPAVFPGELVSRWHGPEHWRQAALATWAHTRRLQLGARAWCGGIGICDVLRLGDTETAMEHARWPQDRPTYGDTNRQFENGFTAGAQGQYIQVDHTPGMCRVLADMMLLCCGGVVRLFPGVPAGMPARFHRLRVPGGFLLSGEKRGEEADYVLVTPTVADTLLRLANPWPGREVELCAMDAAEPVRSLLGEELLLTLTPGRTYRIAPQGVDVGQLSVQDFAVFSSPSPR